jgi:hypothetical protein
MCACNMENVLSVVNADNCINSSKRKRASGLDNCKRELGQCREELRLSQVENVRLTNIVAAMTTMIVELS